MKRGIEARRLRNRVAELGNRGRRPFPADLRRRLVAFTKVRHAEGFSYVAIGEELGVPWSTVACWATEREPVVFKRVEVKSDIAAARVSAPVVVHASGVRVEGLDLAAIADLLRRLSS